MKKELKILEFLFRFPFRVFLLLVAATPFSILKSYKYINHLISACGCCNLIAGNGYVTDGTGKKITQAGFLYRAAKDKGAGAFFAGVVGGTNEHAVVVGRHTGNINTIFGSECESTFFRDEFTGRNGKTAVAADKTIFLPYQFGIAFSGKR